MRGKKILFPTHIALLLVVPSLVLYVFFNTWPMVFSIGLAFTNADRYNISPNPQLLEDLKNSMSCALAIKANETYRERAAQVVKSLYARLDSISSSFQYIKSALEAGAEPWSIESKYFMDLYSASRALARIGADIASVLNCTEIGYSTTRELVPEEALSKIDSLITLAGTIASTYQAMDRDRLYEEVSKGMNITGELKSYFYRLEEDFEGYLADYVASAQREIDRLTLRFVGFENFAQLFRDPRFYNALFKTLLFVATSVPLKVALGVLLALFYSSPLIYGRRIMRALLLVPWAMPFLLSALTWKFLFLPNGQLGLLMNLNINVNEWDAFLVYNLFEAWLAYPFIMTVTQGALRGVSKDVIEAAYIDGAGLLTRMRRVVFPLIAKPVTLAAVLTTGASLQAFLVPLTLNGAGPVGDVCAPYVGCRAGYRNEMLIVFGYNRIVSPAEGYYGYGASIYIVVVLIILAYVVVWFKIMEKSGVR